MPRAAPGCISAQPLATTSNPAAAAGSAPAARPAAATSPVPAGRGRAGAPRRKSRAAPSRPPSGRAAAAGRRGSSARTRRARRPGPAAAQQPRTKPARPGQCGDHAARPAPSASPVATIKRHAGRMAPGGNALVGGQDARLAVEEGRTANAGDDEKHRGTGQQRQRAAGEHDQGHHGLPRHPGGGEMAIDVHRAPGPADLEPDAGQAAADQARPSSKAATRAAGVEAGEGRHQQQAAAGAATDEVGGGAPVPVALLLGRGASSTARGLKGFMICPTRSTRWARCPVPRACGNAASPPAGG
jgi:hypothetical protein